MFCKLSLWIVFCGKFVVVEHFFQFILLSVFQDNFFTNVFPDRMSRFSNVKVVQVVWLARGIQVVTLAQAVQGVQVEEEENFARKYREAGGGDNTKL